MGADWFRKTSWSITDQEDFHRRLARARESNRAQYAFIQGYTLMEQGAEYYAPALSLFDFVIDHYPDSFDLVRALSGKASCLERMGDVEGALAHYFRVIERTRAKHGAINGKPGAINGAWLNFAWLVACNELVHHYETALGLLDEYGREAPIFPVMAFKLYGGRALILSACGLHPLAAENARTALAAADKTTSGLRYHPSIGLVGTRHNDVRARLDKISKTVA